MVKLQDIQRDFLKAIHNQGDELLNHIKDYPKIKAFERFDVHRQTILQNFVNSLEVNFPGIWRLIGEECAKGASLAYSHQLNNLPYMSSLEDFGRHFPEFLANFEATKNLKYLPDFARLEWARCLSYNAINTNPIKQEDLARIDPANMESISFIFNPSVLLLESNFPLDKIQNLLDDPGSKGFDLTLSPNFILICRCLGKVHTLWMAEKDWKFLQLLHQGELLGKAIDCYEAITSDKISELFNLLLYYQMLVDIKY